MLSPKAFDLGLIKLFKGTTPRLALVACSGGVDSMVLLDLLRRHHERRFKTTGGLSVCYVDHQQRRRAETSADRKVIEEYCNHHHLKFTATTIQTKKGASENQLRLARYEALKNQSLPETIIYTGHHAEDNLETLLLRLIRGSHPDSIKGIPARAKRDGLRLARPLLEFSKKEIIDYAQSNKIRWHEDSTNQSKHYARNRLRLELIPLLEELRPGATKRVGRFFKALQQRRSTDTQQDPVLENAATQLLSKQGSDIRQFSFQALKSTIDGLLGQHSQRTTQAHWLALERQLKTRQLTSRGGGPLKTLQFPGGYALQFIGSRLFWMKNS